MCQSYSGQTELNSGLSRCKKQPGTLNLDWNVHFQARLTVDPEEEEEDYRLQSFEFGD